MSKELNKQVVSGVIWQGISQVGNQGISFVISLILARLLEPEEFGTVAIMTIFIGLCGVFVDSGFGSALVQKKDIDDIDCSSVFYINVTMAIFLYGVLFVSAPFVAKFYNNEMISSYLRVLSFCLVIRSFSLVQGTLLSKRMLFHLNFKISWSALISSACVGIFMAYKGFGVWALIAQQLVNAVVNGFMLWLLVKWRPLWVFNWQRVKMLFTFGWKLFFSAFLDAAYKNIYGILIGKLFNLTTLSYYNRGHSIPNLGMGIINKTIGSVIFPALSSIQDDRELMKKISQTGLKIIMFLVVPALGLLFICAEPLVKILFTEKWLPSVIFLQLSCLTFLFWPLHTQNLQIINALGRSDIFLSLEIIKKIQIIIIILITYRYGVIVMVIGLVISGPICFIENSWYSKKLINYSTWQQTKDILPVLVVGTIAGIIATFVRQFLLNDWLKLIITGTVFVVIYLFGTFILKQIPHDIIRIIKERKLN